MLFISLFLLSVSSLCLQLVKGEVYCSTHGCDFDKCLPNSWVCDGMRDCDDGSDEAHCDLQCKKDEFHCLSGGCILKTWRCDGHEDCRDGSDERNCSHVQCPEDKFSCPHSDICIEQSYVCDGINHCHDGADETSQACEEKICPKGAVKCDGGLHCVPQRWICNHIKDCEDGSDELNCPTIPPLTCPQDEFQCRNMDCIPSEYLCDSIRDCHDGSDELNCAHGGTSEGEDAVVFHADACSVNNGGCSHICNNITTPNVARCQCLEGFKLMGDGLTCTDIDECENPTSCSQICKNHPGSYECSCFDGYEKDLQNHTICHAKEQSTDYMKTLIVAILCLSILATLVLLSCIVLRKWKSLNSKKIYFHSSQVKEDHLTEIVSTTKIGVEDEKSHFIQEIA